MAAGDLIRLLVLAALWGGSFLFMRTTVGSFGPLAMIELRVAIAALFLSALPAGRRGLRAARGHWPALWLLGATNSALPFCLFAFSTQRLPGGFNSVLNAVAPMWGLVFARCWLGEPLRPGRVVGLVLGVAGVGVLVWDKLAAGSSGHAQAGMAVSIGAALLATVFYGFSANFTRRALASIDPMAMAAGSQWTAALLLLPGAAWQWPAEPAPAQAWVNVAIMGVACTGLAYVLYFRLIASIGPSRAITVTFLVPVFGVVWGALLLGEAIGVRMLAGGVVILVGTALSTGVLKLPAGRLRTGPDRRARWSGRPPADRRRPGSG